MTSPAGAGPCIPGRDRWLEKASALGFVLASLAAYARWVPEIISFATPLQVPTAGSVGESLHCIWKWVHGQPVYTPLTQIPYSSAYFNWLHYWLYGGFCRLGMSVLGLDDAWIPTIAIVLTIALSLGGVALAAALFLRTMPRVRRSAWHAAILGIVLFGGPMALGWNLSARPDVGALLMECLGVWLALIATQKADEACLGWALSGLAFAAAWSMRVINVGCFAGVLVWLLAQKRWKASAALGVPFTLVVTGTWGVGGAVWRENALLGNAPSPLGLHFALVTVMRSMAKAPLALLATAVAGICWRRRCWRLRRVEGFWSVLMAGTFALALATSFKEGSDQNYWFSFHLASLGLVASLWGRTPAGPEAGAALRPGAAVALCLLLAGVVQAGYAAGRFRVVDTAANGRLAVLKHTLERLPGPVYVCGGFYDNLPWITGHLPPFVCAWTYPQLRERGVTFERDGLRGLIGEGYFGTVVCPLKIPVETAIDGASLEGYRWESRDDYYQYYVIKQRPEK